MLDFAALPPEINSARMYSGPGSAPMLLAAAAWNTMAAEMRSAADCYGSVVSELASHSWLGPSSVSMLAAAAPYLEWLSSTATQAEQAGIQANAAATGFESAFAMTVPPAQVAANRAELAMLVATNVFGQNTPAIAANEAQYAEMWAQDAAAMNGYASASIAATQLTPLTAPQSTTNADGATAAAAQAAETPTGNVQSTLSSAASGASGSSSHPVHLNAPHHVTVQDAFYDCSQPTRKIGYLLTCRRARPIAGSPARRRPIFCYCEWSRSRGIKPLQRSVKAW